MTKGPRTNIGASVRQRLLNLAKSRGQELEFVLVLYAVERFLYRLSVSPHSKRFLLKGAMLFRAWQGAEARPTRDLDLLGFGEVTADSVRVLLADICTVDVPDDGLRFDPASIEVRRIREAQEYAGLRAVFTAALGTAIIRCQVDVGSGDAVTPSAQVLEYPTLLSQPVPRLRAYPKETVVAEKLEAMVRLGISNSRMKDFYDLWMMARSFAFEGRTVAEAIRATFDRRSTLLPEALPLALTDEFLTDQLKQTQWNGFTRGSKLTAPALPDIGRQLAVFLELPLRHARGSSSTDTHWPAGGPWSA